MLDPRDDEGRASPDMLPASDEGQTPVHSASQATSVKFELSEIHEIARLSKQGLELFWVVVVETATSQDGGPFTAEALKNAWCEAHGRRRWRWSVFAQAVDELVEASLLEIDSRGRFGRRKNVLNKTSEFASARALVNFKPVNKLTGNTGGGCGGGELCRSLECNEAPAIAAPGIAGETQNSSDPGIIDGDDLDLGPYAELLVSTGPEAGETDDTPENAGPTAGNENTKSRTSGFSRLPPNKTETKSENAEVLAPPATAGQPENAPDAEPTPSDSLGKSRTPAFSQLPVNKTGDESEKPEVLDPEPKQDSCKKQHAECSDDGEEKKKKRVVATDLTRDLIAFWGKRSGRPKVRYLERRVVMVRARLKEGYTPDDLFRAIAGVCYSPFHKEGGYDTFEIALRNGAQVEKGMQLWLLHAPPRLVADFQRRTGAQIKARQEELSKIQKQERMQGEFQKRYETILAEQAEERKARDEERRLEDETTEYVLSCLAEEEQEQCTNDDDGESKP